MLTTRDALDAQIQAATHKEQQLRTRLWSFIVAGLFGGAYIGIGGVLMLSAAGPLVVAGDPFAKLVGGLVFGVGLVIVVFAGAELVTSTMMTAAQALAARAMSIRGALLVLFVTIIANFAGAFVFSALVSFGGVLRSNAAAGAMLGDVLQGRADQSPIELLLRAILCNMLVCLAIWMSTRITSAGARVAVILLGILAFVASGYEHVVANMTFYWLGMFAGDPNASAALFAGNMLWVGLGNLVGGGIIVGLGTWVVAGSPRVDALQRSGSGAQVTSSSRDRAPR